MNFEQLLNDDMLVENKKETNQNQKINNNSVELEELIRKVVREEVNRSMNEAVERLEANLTRMIDNFTKKQAIEDSRECVRKRERQSVDIRRLATKFGSMQCSGWIFYVNEQEGKHLWKIRDDGSDNQELYAKTISSVEKVEDGYVFFEDASFNVCKMPINGGQVHIESRY